MSYNKTKGMIENVKLFNIYIYTLVLINVQNNIEILFLEWGFLIILSSDRMNSQHMYQNIFI